MFTHLLTKPQTRIMMSVLAASYGYPAGGKDRLFGFLLSMLGPVRERAGASVLFLHARDRGKLLDVGCGSGRFLAQMQALGWEVFGLEPDTRAARIARNQYDLNVICGIIEQAPILGESVDIIAMNHVIEHLSDPLAALVECRRILKSGGKLIVLTPNIRSLGRQIWRQYWRGWEIPRHFFLFSAKSLRVLIEQSGFAIHQLRTVSTSAYYIWITSQLIEKNALMDNFISIWTPLLTLQGMAFEIIEYNLARRWNVGEELLMVATKGGE